MEGEKKTIDLPAIKKMALKSILWLAQFSLCMEKNISVASCMEGGKVFLEGKKTTTKRLPYLPSIEAGTLVGATADITAAT